MKQSRKNASVGTRIIQGLQEFADTLRKGQPITEKFTFWIVDNRQGTRRKGRKKTP
jgi:hypothetical protein